jgi:hypothetical protein
VLVNDFHLTFIFKEIKNNMYISHCSIIDRGNDVIVNSMAEREVGDVNLVKCHPATREQHDILFNKMKEAGYEWNDEKKELKKSNSYCQKHCKGFQETGRCFADGDCKAKIEAEQKPAWSKEDEKMLADACIMLDWYKGNNWWKSQYIKDWLKSLKERIGG